ncbi:MAG: Enoyl-CoA hydratase/isomerase [Jatrophihabitantaceae bacterium]|nr:Enoyl-CoA hydratase/isomerase [Jatrophihabitantaceae bacterium]
MSDVLIDKQPSGVMVVTLNRPDKLNSMGGTLTAEFAAAMADARLDTDVRAVIITGAGRAFCAGADLEAANTGSSTRASHPSYNRGVGGMQVLHDQMAGSVFRCPKPTIALVNGAAAGGGFGVALACDFRIASEKAIFVSAFARIGLPGDNGVTYGLSRLMSRSEALEILMLSPRITAAEAKELGIVRSVVAPDDLMAAGLAFAKQLADGPTEAFAIMKRNLEYAYNATYAASLEQEAAGISTSYLIGENKSAIQAFLDKTEPDFRNRSHS